MSDQNNTAVIEPEETLYTILSRNFGYLTVVLLLLYISKQAGWLADTWIYYEAQKSEFVNEGFGSVVANTALKVWVGVLYFLASFTGGAYLFLILFSLVVCGIIYVFHKWRRISLWVSVPIVAIAIILHLLFVFIAIGIRGDFTEAIRNNSTLTQPTN